MTLAILPSHDNKGVILVLLAEDCPFIPDEVNKMKNIPFCKTLGLLI